MSIHFDNSADTGGFVGTSDTTAFTCSGSNRMLFVSAHNYGGSGADTVSGITYAGQALSKIGSSVQVPTFADLWLSLWYLVNPTSGANNVVTTLSSNSLSCSCRIASYTGVLQNSPIDQTGTSTISTDTSISKTLTTTESYEWAVAAIHLNSGTVSAGADTTQREGLFYDNNSSIIPAGNVTLTAEITTSVNACMIMATFKAAPTNGGSFLYNFV